MTTPMFSINAAAELLERDRRTIQKSLRHTPPDGKEGRAGRWRLKTIIDALERMQPPRTPANNGSSDPRLETVYRQLDAAETEMKKLPTVAKRRLFAVNTLRPIISETLHALDVWGRVIGRDPEYTTLLGDRMFMLALRGWEKPCQWSQSQCWDAMNGDDDA